MSFIPAAKLEAFIIEFRDACYYEKFTKAENIRNKFEEYSKQLTVNQKILVQIEFDIIEWETHGGYYFDLLQATKNRLEDLQFLPYNTSSLSKWSTLSSPPNVSDVESLFLSPSSLKELKTSESHVLEKQKKDKLLEKVNALLRKIEKDNHEMNRQAFESIQAAFNKQTQLNLDAFTHALLNFYRSCFYDREKYETELSMRLQALTNEEIIQLYQKTNSPLFLSFANAFYVLKFFPTEDECFNDKACKDAIKVWHECRDYLEWKMVNKLDVQSDIPQIALIKFSEAASRMNTLLVEMHKEVKEIYTKRNLQSKFPKQPEIELLMGGYEWPKELSKRVPVSISSTERKLIGETVKNYYVDTQHNYAVQEKLNQYFSKMMNSFGFFFNSNRFFDVISKLSPKQIEWSLAEGTEKELKVLYKSLKSTDLNSLMALLHQIKVSDDKYGRELFARLSIPYVTSQYQNFRRLAERLYDPVHTLMQTTRHQLEKFEKRSKPDYSYQSFSQKSSEYEHLLTSKNTACLKQLVDKYLGLNLVIERTWIERFYDWMYPSNEALTLTAATLRMRKVDPRLVRIDELDEVESSDSAHLGFYESEEVTASDSLCGTVS